MKDNELAFMTHPQYGRVCNLLAAKVARIFDPIAFKLGWIADDGHDLSFSVQMPKDILLKHGPEILVAALP